MGRRKIIQDEELLAVARDLFVEKGIGASTREIAHNAGISEAVIYQRYPTKTDLFFAAMVLPSPDVEKLLKGGTHNTDVCNQLEQIALGMMEYFREIVPILVLLVTHESFDFERFTQRHPESPLARLRVGLMDYLKTQQALGNVVAENVGSTVLTLVAAVHSFALFERLGVHGGEFGEEVIRAMVRSLWWGLAPPGDRK